jgi:hypothetical protein
MPMNCIYHKEELLDQWKESTVSIHKKCDITVYSNYHGISTAINFRQNFIKYPSLKVKSIYRLNCWGVISVSFMVT